MQSCEQIETIMLSLWELDFFFHLAGRRENVFLSLNYFLNSARASMSYEGEDRIKSGVS